MIWPSLSSHQNKVHETKLQAQSFRKCILQCNTLHFKSVLRSLQDCLIVFFYLLTHLCLRMVCNALHRLWVFPVRMTEPPSRRNWRRWRKHKRRLRNSGKSVRKRPDAADGCLQALTLCADDVQRVNFPSFIRLNSWHNPLADCYNTYEPF